MAFDINWSALRPVDIQGSLTQGFATGQSLVKQGQVQGALKAYMANPDDEGALGALAALDPATAANFERMRANREEAAAARAKTALTSQLGGMAATDPRGAATAALRAGQPDLAKQFFALGKDQQDAAAARFKAAAPVAYQALKLPDIGARKAFIMSNKEALVAQGWTPEQIDAFDPTDAALGSLVTTATTLEQLRGQDELKEFNVGPGEARYARDPKTGEIITIIEPNTGGATFGAPVGKPSAGGGSIPAAHPAEQSVASVLSAAGLPAPVVAGFAGNFRIEGGYGGAKGDGGASHGIAQWNGDRLANFQRIIGKAPADAAPAEQAKFVLWEIQNPEAAGMTKEQRDAIVNAKTPGEAAALIDQYYERSSGAHRAKRVAEAERIGGGAAPAGGKDAIRAAAQRAIASGADPEAVKARAAAQGVEI